MQQGTIDMPTSLGDQPQPGKNSELHKDISDPILPGSEAYDCDALFDMGGAQ